MTPRSAHPPAAASRLAPLGLAFAIGVGVFYLLPALPPTWTIVPLGLVAVILLLFERSRISSRFWRPLAALFAGTLFALIHTEIQLGEPFPDRLARARLTVAGRIVSIPAETGFGTRFLLEVETTSAEGDRVPFTGLVRLSWQGAPADLRAGEVWRLPVRLKPGHGFANPGGFDYERWLFEQGIKATGNVRAGEGVARLDPGPGPARLTRLRQDFATHLEAVLGEAPALGLIQALTIGDQSGFEPQDWEVMARTGTNHLVSISGFHVGLISAAVFFLARWIWSRSAVLTLRLAAPRAAAVAAALAALCYSALAGFAVPTQRSLIMLAVVLGALFWERTLRPWHALTLALVGVLLLDPRAVLSAGAWLSFGAVAVLFFNLGQRLPSRDLWTRFGRAQWAVGIGLLPLLFFLFGRASTVAPLVNLVAVPLFSLILPLVLVSSLLSLVPGLTLPLQWMAELLAWCLTGLAWVADWPGVAVTLAERSLWVWATALVGVVLLLAPRGLPGRWLGLVLVLPMWLVRPPVPGPGELWFTLLDVGQGLSAVLQTGDGTLVFDTGPGVDGGFNAGTRVIAPFLAAVGVNRVEVLVLSHADRDHTGGAGGLMARLPVGRVLSGEPGQLGLPDAEPCRAGAGWTWSGVRFEFLNPLSVQGAAKTPVGNDASCVLRVETGGHAILLTGDISQRIESRLVADLGKGMASTVLVAGHHGSATSTGATFLDTVAPGLVLYASGYANPFRFPSPEVQARVAARGIPALDTAETGAIELRLSPDGSLVGPATWRTRARRLWTHVPAAPDPLFGGSAVPGVRFDAR